MEAISLRVQEVQVVLRQEKVVQALALLSVVPRQCGLGMSGGGQILLWCRPSSAGES